MTRSKRLVDIVVAGARLLLVLPGLAGLAALLLAAQGRPVLHVSRRCKAPGRTFGLIKFRTMIPDAGDRGVSGGDKAARITPLGGWLRAYRLDELPQLVNVLRGDLSLVGPRAPLPDYVDRFPDLYAQVLQCRPGLTGLATLVFHRHEARLLARCATASDTDAVYARRCVPRKARIDLIYRARRSLALDAWILGRTVLSLVTAVPERPRTIGAGRVRHGRRSRDLLTGSAPKSSKSPLCSPIRALVQPEG